MDRTDNAGRTSSACYVLVDADCRPLEPGLTYPDLAAATAAADRHPGALVAVTIGGDLDAVRIRAAFWEEVGWL